MNIKKDDKVVVLSGKNKGKEGKVLSADPKCGKPTRVAHKITDGKKARICKKCGAEL